MRRASPLLVSRPGDRSRLLAGAGRRGRATGYEFDDSHFHLTNYVQEGTDVRDFLRIMGTRAGRSTLFGIPLQQTWSYENSGDYAPTYYLQTDAPLYYYSFTDAFIAMAYRSLPPEQQARFDPMITGFNPADMYAADHIRRVLRDLSRRLHRDRRVHHSQGVRVVQGRGRGRQPDRSRRSTASSTSPARWDWSCCSTTTWTCRSPRRAPSRST